MDFLVPVAALAVSLVVGFIRAWLVEDVLPQRAARQAQAGRRRHLAVQVHPHEGRSRRGTLSRAGADVHVVTSREHWLVPVALLLQARGTTLLDERDLSSSWSVRLNLPDGQRASLEIPSQWRPTLEAVLTSTDLDAHARIGHDTRPVAAPPPRWAGFALVVGLILLGLWSSLLLAATERTSPVLAITDDGLACWVEWSEGGVLHRGAPTCPDPPPAVGDELRYLTTPWPVAGNAWDTELPWALAALLALVSAFAMGRLALAWALGLRRTRRPPQQATVVAVAAGPAPGRELSVAPAAVPPGAPGDRRPDDGGAASTRLVALADHAAEALAWSEEPVGHPGPGRGGLASDLARAWGGVPHWPGYLAAAAGLGALATTEDLPALAAVALGAAAVALAWFLWGLVSTMRMLRATWALPFTSEWEYRVAREATGTWLVLLVLGRRAHWLIPVPGRPDTRGTCLVRGDLAEGGSVHLQIGDDVWLPVGPVARVDDELAGFLLEELTFQLDGDVAADPVRPR